MTKMAYDLLEKHDDALKKIAVKVFAKELECQDDVIKKLPLIKWTECQEAPGAICLYLLCFSGNRKTTLFAEEMLSNWLVQGEQLKILSARNQNIRFAHIKRSLFFAELLVLIPDDKTVQNVKRQLPGVAADIKLGTLSAGHAKHVLEMKRLSLAGKTSFIYDTMVYLIQRYPKRFSHDIFRAIQHFLVHCREEFRKIRQMRHLCRIICAHYLFQKALEHDIKIFPFRRHLYLKLMKTHLHYPFGLKKVLGLAFALNSLGDYECLDFRHIVKAIQRIIPQIEARKESCYLHRDEDNGVLTVYIEIEKTKGGDFSLEEVRCLKKELPNELKNSIEYLSPSLFIPRNEEELIRNIINLSGELRFVRDLPQAMISFQEQRHDALKFNIILLRILNKDDTSLQEMSRHLPTKVHYIPERVANVGYLRKKYVKEANVFSLEVDNQLFLRKNHSVDLVKARQYVAKALEKMIGNFRDFNGGFLLKQNEQLEEIKKTLGAQAKPHEFLLENLFYSLSPSIMQTYIPPHAGKELAWLFLKMLEIDLPIQHECLIEIKQEESFIAVVVKASLAQIKENFAEKLKSLKLDSQIASSVVEVDRYFYFCYLFLSPAPEQAELFIETCKGIVQAWKEQRENLQILHLHLTRAAQSLDPRLAADRTSGIVIKMLYEGLFRQAASGEIEPGIAREVIISEDFQKYIFKLRPSFWSNGTPLTAYDFEYAWKKILQPDFRFPYSFLFFAIKNAEAAKKGEVPVHHAGVRALDDETLVVELEHPASYFLGLTTSWVFSPLCREIDQKHPGWAYHSGDTYVCNGPFKLDGWKLNDDIQFVKNPLYWDSESVKLDNIRITIIEDEKIALKMFFKKELDWVGDPLSKLPTTEVPTLKQRNLVYTANNRYGLFWFQLDVKRLPFSNANLRKAFAYAINREMLIKNVLYSDGIPAYGFTYQPSLDTSNFKDGDYETACKLFEAGLAELKLKKQDLPPIVLTHSEIEEQEALTREIGKQWQQLFGVSVVYECLLWSTYFDTLSRGDVMAGGLMCYPRFEDPVYYYNLFIFREHSLHVTDWKNPTFNELVEKAKKTLDKEKSAFYLERAEQLLVSEMPVIPLFYQKFRYVKNPRLKGYILSNINQIEFREAYLEMQKTAEVSL